MPSLQNWMFVNLLAHFKHRCILVSLDSKMPRLNIKTLVTSSVICVFVDSKSGLYDVTISNFEGMLELLYVKNATIDVI